MRAVRTRRRSQQMPQGTFSCASAIHLVAGDLQDFQSFRSRLTLLICIHAGDEVIAALMCVDTNYELIEVPSRKFIRFPWLNFSNKNRVMKRKIIAASIIALAGTSVATAYSAAPALFLNFERPDIRFQETHAYSILSVNTPLNITLNFSGELTESQKEVFQEAKSAWEARLSGYQPGINISSITIDASSKYIDGPSGTLGRAGPTNITQQAGFTLATKGIMEFDSADMSVMENNGQLQAVIEHEMGHVLGVGTLWPHNSNYVIDSYQYTGVNGIDAWNAEFILPSAPWSSIPVEDEGGEWTRNGHWKEDNTLSDSQGRTMTHELMTGWINLPVFFSNTTLHSMLDLGFTITQPLVDLSISTNGGGKIVGPGVDCVNNCTMSFASDSTISLEALADAAYYFAGWGGDCSGVDETCNLVLNADKVVSANFQLRPEPVIECFSGPEVSGTYVQDTIIQSENALIVTKDLVVGKQVKLAVESASSISFAKEFSASKYAQISAEIIAGLSCGEPQS